MWQKSWLGKGPKTHPTVFSEMVPNRFMTIKMDNKKMNHHETNRPYESYATFYLETEYN